MDGFIWAAATEQESLDEEPETVSQLRGTIANLQMQLATKAMQQSQRDQAERAAQEKALEERARELAEIATASKDQALHEATLRINQLEAALAQTSEELEESRRLHVAQKRALKGALAAAAEREAREQEAADASAQAASLTLEAELEALTQELADTQTRCNLALHSKDAEMAAVRAQLDSAHADREQAVAAARAEALEQLQAEVDKASSSRAAQVAGLQAEIARLRAQSEDMARASASEDWVTEVAALNKAKCQVQREFDAFKDLAGQATLQHRQEVARLQEEIAALKARIASDAANMAMGLSSRRGMLGQVMGLGTPAAPARKTFSALPHSSQDSWLDWLVWKLEARQRGLVPLLVVTGVLLLLLSLAALRMASNDGSAACALSRVGLASARSCLQPALGPTAAAVPLPAKPSAAGAGAAAAAAKAGVRRLMAVWLR